MYKTSFTGPEIILLVWLVLSSWLLLFCFSVTVFLISLYTHFLTLFRFIFGIFGDWDEPLAILWWIFSIPHHVCPSSLTAQNPRCLKLWWLGLGSHSDALLTDSQAAPLPFRIHLGLTPWFSAAHGDAVGMLKALSYPKHMGTQPLTLSTREAGSRGHWILGRHMKKEGWKRLFAYLLPKCIVTWIWKMVY